MCESLLSWTFHCVFERPHITKAILLRSRKNCRHFLSERCTILIGLHHSPCTPDYISLLLNFSCFWGLPTTARVTTRRGPGSGAMVSSFLLQTSAPPPSLWQCISKTMPLHDHFPLSFIHIKFIACGSQLSGHQGHHWIIVRADLYLHFFSWHRTIDSKLSVMSTKAGRLLK